MRSRLVSAAGYRHLRALRLHGVSDAPASFVVSQQLFQPRRNLSTLLGDAPPAPVALPSRASRVSSHIWCDDEDARSTVDEMLRVDHAGEVGAVRIYEGQMMVLKGTPEYDIVKVCCVHGWAR